MSSDHAATSPLSADNPLMPRLYQAAIGPLRTDYYQQQFERFDTLGKPMPRWNWPAGFCTLGWMTLRGLWLPAAAYAGALLAVVLLWWGFDLHQLLPRPVATALALLLVLLAVAVPGLWGNALYHRTVRERTMQALTQSNTLGEAMEQLQAQAPNSTRLQWATSGQFAFALLLLALLWSMSTASPPRPVVTPAPTGLTQQDTARALAALMPATAPQPGADSTEAPSATEPTPSSAAALAIPAEGIALNLPEMPALTLAPATAAATPEQVTSPALAQSAEQGNPALAPTIPVPPSPTAPVAESAAKVAPATAATTQAEPAKKDAKAPRASSTDRPHKAGADDQRSKTSKSTKNSEERPAEKSASKRAVAAGKTVLQPGKYYLNSGLYAQADNAKRVASQLRAAGQPVFTQTLESSKGEVTRVRVGPFNSRAQAEAAARKIHSLRLEAQLFRHTPG